MADILKKIAVFFMVIILDISLLNCSQCVAREKDDAGSLYSIACALVDGDTGRVLYEKNGYEKRAMASTTKIMTLILALEYGNMEDVVTVSSYAVKMPDVKLGLREGEQYILKDLIYSMMLESHNDSAVAIAEHVGGSVEKFAKMMNYKAREIGLSDTYFITPNGLDAVDKGGKHSTTAVNLALLMKYCVMESDKREEFIRICQTRSYSFSEYSGKRAFDVRNHNRFLDMADGVIAGKTGFTADAGYCYVTAVENKGRTFIIALLGCGWPGNKNYKWSDTKKLLAYGCDNYSYKEILDRSYKIDNIPICDGIEADNIALGINENIGLILSDKDEVRIERDIPESVSAPVGVGDIVGCLKIYVNDVYFRGVNVYSCNDVKKTSFLYYFSRVVNEFIIR